MALIQLSEYFDFPEFSSAVKGMEDANKSFATTTIEVYKRIKTSFDDYTKDLKDYVTLLQNFNVNQKNAAGSLAATADAIEGLKKKQQDQKKIMEDVLATNNLLEKSVNDLRTTQKALVAEYNSLGNTEQKDIARKKEIAATVGQLTGAINTQATALKTAKKVVDAAEGSYNKMRDDLKQVSLALKALPNAFDPVSGKLNKQNKEAVELNAKYLQLTTSLKSADKGMGDFFRNVGNYEGAIGKLTEGVGHFAGGLLLAVGIIPGLFGLVKFLEDSVKLFNEEQVAITQFQNILHNIGREDAFDTLREKAHALSEEFKTFKDADIIGVFQQLIQYGKLTENQITDILPVIINFATITGQSLPDATNTLLKSLEGNNRGLKQFGINIRDAKNTTEAFNLVMTELKPRVEGAAKAFGDTTAGQIKKTEVQIDELKEKIGQELQPAIKTFYQTISDGLKGIPQIFATFKGAIDSVLLTISTGVKQVYILTTQGVSGLVAFNATLNAQAADRKKAQEDDLFRQDALTNAQNFANDARTKSLKEQQSILKQQTTILDADKAKALEINRASEKDPRINNTKEYIQANRNLIQSLLIVQKLQDNVTAAKDTRVLGLGDPNAPFSATKPKEDHSAEIEAAKQLKALHDYENARIQINADALARIGNDETLSANVRAFALQKLLDLQIELIHKKANDEIQENKLTSNEVLAVREKEKAEIIKLQQDETDKVAAIVKKDSENRIKAQTDVLNAKSASIKAELKIETDANEKSTADFLANEEKKKKIIEDTFNELSKSLNAIAQVVGNSEADVFYSLSEIIKASVDDGKVSLEQYAALAISVGNAVTDKLNAADEQRISNLEKNKERELTLAGNNAAAQAAINERYAHEEAKIKRKEAVNNKINALFQIAINTAVAASKTLGETGIFGIPLLPLIIGLGLAEAALVLAQPLPAFEKGTDYAKEGPALVDEKGTELIVDRHGNLKEIGGAGPRITHLDEGDKVFTATKTKEILRQMEEGKIMREMQLTHTLSHKIREGRQAEAIYTMAAALRSSGLNNGHMEHAFKEAVKDIPIHQMFIDEKGQYARLKKRNDTTTFLNTYNFGHKK